jgi:hypothetical protein
VLLVHVCSIVRTGIIGMLRVTVVVWLLAVRLRLSSSRLRCLSSGRVGSVVATVVHSSGGTIATLSSCGALRILAQVLVERSRVIVASSIAALLR